MIINTERFGDVDVAEIDVMQMTSPLPGFYNTQNFFFLQKDSIKPFKWMQSVQEPALTFVVVEPQYFFHDYAPVLNTFDVKEIGAESLDSVDVIVIVVLPEDMSKMTANLKGPLIINKQTQKMKQVFIDSERWTVRESILDGIKRKEASESPFTVPGVTDKEEKSK